MLSERLSASLVRGEEQKNGKVCPEWMGAFKVKDDVLKRLQTYVMVL